MQWRALWRLSGECSPLSRSPDSALTCRSFYKRATLALKARRPTVGLIKEHLDLIWAHVKAYEDPVHV